MWVNKVFDSKMLKILNFVLIIVLYNSLILSLAEEATPNNFPFIVSVIYAGGHSSHGILLEGTRVLGNPHCLANANSLGGYLVKAGAYYTQDLVPNKNIKGQQSSNLVNSGVHPCAIKNKEDGDGKVTNFKYSIAIFELSSKINFQPNEIDKIEEKNKITNEQLEEIYKKKEAIIIGWGIKTKPDGDTFKTLQRFKSSIVDPNECTHDKNFSKRAMLCAQIDQDDIFVDTCGAVLMARWKPGKNKKDKSEYILLGLGLKPQVKGKKGMAFINVNKFLCFIRDNESEDSDDCRKSNTAFSDECKIEERLGFLIKDSSPQPISFNTSLFFIVFGVISLF